MASFTVDLKGRLNNTTLPEYKAMWPLFEAVVNSIQSIEESANCQNGRIEITAIREENNQYDMSGKIEIGNFITFSIMDNGEGFCEKNYNSFTTADSSLKWKKGCKGIGRFLWLKAFAKVNISSIFYENSRWMERTFEFSENGTLPDDNLKPSEFSEYKTTITLCDFARKYKEKIPKSLEALSKKIIEHCLIYFLSENCPNIILRDNLGETINLNSYFEKNIKDSLHQDEIMVENNKFSLYHLKMMEGVTTHELHLCANNREVLSIDLKKKINNLQSRISESGECFYYAGYLMGEYLDQNVNNTRTNFEFADNQQMDMSNNIKYDDLVETAKEFIVTYLSDYLTEIDIRKKKAVNDYVFKKQPKYRYLLNNRPHIYDNLPSDISEDKLELMLYQEVLNWDMDTKRAGEKIQEEVSKNIISASEAKEKYDEYFRSINDLSKTSLAEYIIRRKVILDLLENALQIKEDGTYVSEDSIHSIICPMRYTSDEISFEEMNLWIIDERLSYHNFLASDKQMKAIPVIETSSDKRMDIAVFDEAFSFSDKDDYFNSITIIEFKKPNRNDLKPDEKNPIHQVLGYVEDIKSGKKKRANGRPFGNVEHTAFYCYVIADMTDSLKSDAKYASLNPTPDGEGYYGYNQSCGAYVEVISFTKLLRDAKDRNKILFDKLFNPSIKTMLDNGEKRDNGIA